MKVYLFLSLLFIQTSIYGQGNKLKFYRGTCIVEYWKKDSIWIAADSKLREYGSSKKLSVYKIMNKANIYYVTAGYTQLVDAKTHETVFDADKEIYSLLDPSLTSEQMGDVIRNVITPKMTKTLKRGFDENSFNFDEILKQFPLQIILSRLDRNGNPDIYFIPFKVEGIRNNWQLLSQGQNKSDSFYQPIGHANFIVPFMDDNQNYFKKPGSVTSKLNHLICLEIKKDTVEVGLPIDFVLITNKGGQKLPQSNKCN